MATITRTFNSRTERPDRRRPPNHLIPTRFIMLWFAVGEKLASGTRKGPFLLRVEAMSRSSRRQIIPIVPNFIASVRGRYSALYRGQLHESRECDCCEASARNRPTLLLRLHQSGLSAHMSFGISGAEALLVRLCRIDRCNAVSTRAAGSAHQNRRTHGTSFLALVATCTARS
jgi:hypothetical protein